jgi:hypothetical protein
MQRRQAGNKRKNATVSVQALPSVEARERFSETPTPKQTASQSSRMAGKTHGSPPVAAPIYFADADSRISQK